MYGFWTRSVSFCPLFRMTNPRTPELSNRPDLQTNSINQTSSRPKAKAMPMPLGARNEVLSKFAFF